MEGDTESPGTGDGYVRPWERDDAGTPAAPVENSDPEANGPEDAEVVESDQTPGPAADAAASAEPSTEDPARDPGPPAGSSPATPPGPPSSGESEEEGLDDLTGGDSHLDGFTREEYLATTTREYQGLAEDVERAGSDEFERQAVAASMPGVGTGLIGFEDVTGRRGVSEEDVEQAEQAKASDLTLRVASAIVLIGLFVGSLLLGGVWFSAFVTIIMMLSLAEFYATLREVGYRPLALFGFAGVVGAAIGAARSGPVAIAGWLVGTVVVVMLFYSLVARRKAFDNASLTIFGMIWVSMLSFAIIIGQAEDAVALILLVVIVTAVFDMGAYFVGKAFGRRRIAPSVSPNKTLEGLVGGVVATVSVAVILSTFPVFEPLTLESSVVLALVVCVLAPLGDAAESVVKRALDVKDMGSLLPGHGGMLDRIDALLFVVPVAYYLFRGLGYL